MVSPPPGDRKRAVMEEAPEVTPAEVKQTLIYSGGPGVSPSGPSPQRSLPGKIAGSIPTKHFVSLWPHVPTVPLLSAPCDARR